MDMWELDTNVDGITDQTAYDTNFDSYADAWVIDTNQDSYTDQLAFDTTGDAAADIWSVDANQDGWVDTMWQDTDLDGYADFSAAPTQAMTMSGEITPASSGLYPTSTTVGGTEPGWSGPYDASGNPVAMPTEATVGPATSSTTAFPDLMAIAQQQGDPFAALTFAENIWRQNMTGSIWMY